MEVGHRPVCGQLAGACMQMGSGHGSTLIRLYHSSDGFSMIDDFSCIAIELRSADFSDEVSAGSVFLRFIFVFLNMVAWGFFG